MLFPFTANAYFFICFPALGAKDPQQQAQNAIEMTMNAQMLSALGGYIPGLDPAYLSYMYSGIPGYFPGMGLSMMQPGLIPGMS